MRLIHHYLLILCSLLCLSSAAQLQVSAILDSSSIRVGEQTKLDLYVSYRNTAGATKIDWPAIYDTLNKHVEVVSRTAIDTTIPDKNDPSTLQQHIQLTVTAFDSGYFAIAPFKFVLNNDTANPFLTEVLLLEVHTVPTDTAEANLKDIKGPFSEDFNWKWYLPYAYWTLGVVAAILAIILVIYKFLRKKPEVPKQPDAPKIPAHITALANLDKIKADSVWKEDKVKEYYSSIADTIRLYIEERFEVNALELTSEEIIQIFRTQVVDAQSKEKLTHLLRLSDLVKFAKQIPVESEHTLVLQDAYDFVNGTKREVVAVQETPTPTSQEQPVKNA